MKTLNLQEIKRDGLERVEFASKMEELQPIVVRLFPGHKLAVISIDEAEDEQPVVPSKNSDDDFRSLTGVQQMVVVLNEKPMTARDLFAEIQHRGAAIPMSTVQSTLSRKKSVFHNNGDGTWSLTLRGTTPSVSNSGAKNGANLDDF